MSYQKDSELKLEAEEKERKKTIALITSIIETNIGRKLNIERSRIRGLNKGLLIELSRVANQISSYRQLIEWFDRHDPEARNTQRNRQKKQQLEM